MKFRLYLEFYEVIKKAINIFMLIREYLSVRHKFINDSEKGFA